MGMAPAPVVPANQVQGMQSKQVPPNMVQMSSMHPQQYLNQAAQYRGLQHQQQQQHHHQAQHQNMQHSQQVNISQSTSRSQSQPQSSSHQHGRPTQVLSWQSDKDVADRREMIQKIVRLLQLRKPNAPQEWLKKLPQMAKRLEESLYRSAKSFDEYNNSSTLKFRLQQLAMTIGQKTQKKKLEEEQKKKERPSQSNPQPPPQRVVAPQQPNPMRSMVNMNDMNKNFIRENVPSQVNQPIDRHFQSISNPPGPAPAPQQPAPTKTPSQPSTRPSSDRQQVLRHQQQRLLLLRHAAKCPHENGKCPVTPHCGGMKRLWKHIAECKDQKCLVPHCVSSRYVLSHYHRCKDPMCPVCGPVREAIHRSHEKSKNIQLQKEKALQNEQNHAPKPQPPLSVVSTPKPIEPQPQPQPQPQLPPQPQPQPQLQLQPQPPPQPQQQPQPQLQPQLQPQPQQHSQPQPQSQPQPKQIVQPLPKPQPIIQPVVVSSQPPSQPQHKPQPPKPQQPPPPQPQQVPPPVQPLPPQVTQTQHSKSVVPNPTSISQPNKRRKSVGPPKNVPSMPQVPAVPPVVSRPPPVLSAPQLPLNNPSANVNHVPSNISSKVMPKGPIKKLKEVPSSRPKEDHTLINSFTIEQIETHIASLNTGLRLPPQELKKKCLEVLKGLMAHNYGWVFNSPVDPVELNLPDYFQIIKKPMDLGTIKKRLENGCYHDIKEFESEVNLTFDNATLYNVSGSVVHTVAKEMKTKFKVDFKKLLAQLNAEEEEKRKKGDACALCGCEKLLFEPQVFYCNGASCPSKRIRRNSYYYVGAVNQYHWCHQCYGELKDGKIVEMGEVVLKKADLVKKKHDEVHEESWVACDKCERWIHQICGLFNTRQNKSQTSEYTCPMCTIEDMKKKPKKEEPRMATPGASDLPRTKLSEALESHVKYMVEKKYEYLIEEKAEVEQISKQEARVLLDVGGPITIRQVSSMDRKLEVRDRMRKRYAFKNYPEEFTYRCKCLIVFQNLDGVDVILFGLYVYEHDEKNPAPNTRTVYVSYLDSVHYMRPRRMRTFVYHEILISYLDYVRKKGYSIVHIWACPPLKGDDYILYAKPEDQKTPKDDRLRQWYIDMLYECQNRGIVGKLTNMFDLYFKDGNDATVIPYLEGDYFVSEAENIIKDIEEGGNKKKNSSSGSKKSKKKDKSGSGSGRGGTRSTGLDEDALRASGIAGPDMSVQSLQDGGKDYVMTKLGETIQPMKESFIVAFLNWSGAREEDKVVNKEIVEERERRLAFGELSLINHGSSEMGPYKKSEKALAVATSGTVSGGDKKSNMSSSTGSNNKSNGEKKDVIMDKSALVSADKNLDSRKRDVDGNVKPDKVDLLCIVKSKGLVDKNGCPVKVTDDDKEEIDCEFLNNRQAFLNLCQGNHYQFDQLRRAKHTSVMVLWHLHNPDAPKFVLQCTQCSREILQGVRYHCKICPDFELCQDCYRNPNLIKHQHPLQAIAVSGQTEMTEAQRKERQRSIKQYMGLLLHAATCVSPTCRSANCAKMKGLLKHGQTCQEKAAGGCHICKRIWALLQIHARQCKQKNCPVPKCMAIRDHSRRIALQQQAMDDRRRQEMNRTYAAATAAR
eukprot:CAMPEP_0113305838 /NCGR_PEP_ID=MMETSP0010_2-20120614/5322_1 /TAXON_ID=216773 ORGANISM="Corethron hystrix, Strain 308" /NCGR_SAMPLE_ID=MMETSP0010_2 /ASSEMBLY_ACC=CAM_ASM_000155 /LENGTH=1600 /DNA_ID=CAMNT_0000160371 /DNA_START=446 /DNA_END=5248 /DNA_ORIENTATION=- /assembly_acc=CAM_ASM_000155